MVPLQQCGGFLLQKIEYNKDDGHSAGGMIKILPDMVL